MARATYTQQARLDLEGILDYLDGQRSQSADRFATKLDQACGLHAAHPQMGASAEVYAPNLRDFIVWNYAIFYRPTADGIEIIRAIHGARDIPGLFGPQP